MENEKIVPAPSNRLCLVTGLQKPSLRVHAKDQRLVAFRVLPFWARFVGFPFLTAAAAKVGQRIRVLKLWPECSKGKRRGVQPKDLKMRCLYIAAQLCFCTHFLFFHIFFLVEWSFKLSLHTLYYVEVIGTSTWLLAFSKDMHLEDWRILRQSADVWWFSHFSKNPPGNMIPKLCKERTPPFDGIPFPTRECAVVLSTSGSLLRVWNEWTQQMFCSIGDCRRMLFWHFRPVECAEKSGDVNGGDFGWLVSWRLGGSGFWDSLICNGLFFFLGSSKATNTRHMSNMIQKSLFSRSFLQVGFLSG